MGKLSSEELSNLTSTLHKRFEKNMHRHSNHKWEIVLEKILQNPSVINTLFKMEASEGEPDVVDLDQDVNVIIFCDCSPESPKGRRSLCYDLEALNSRKEHKPKSDAFSEAKEIGIQLLDENQYFQLQSLDKFDLKTSSWLLTPPELRKLGGALFGDRRYDRTFIYHNGAESYYGARGFRGWIKI